MSTHLPSLYLPHGGGPCFFMDWTMGPPDTWKRLQTWLEGLLETFPERPRRLLVISAHWETPVVQVTTHPEPELIYDYYGFPEHTYQLQWPAPGDPELAQQVLTLLQAAQIPAEPDPHRGWDHGVFIPFKVAVPEADVPTVALSLRADLDPAFHYQVGQALRPLKEQGVLIVGSGMSYHNLPRMFSGSVLSESHEFDAWLQEWAALPEPERQQQLVDWKQAPQARNCHPREEHLAPLFVAAGASLGGRAWCPFTDQVMGATVSALAFD